MKKILKAAAVACAVLAVSSASAQDIIMSRTGEVTLPDGTRRYIVPTTTLVVDITIKKETVKTGPYARFAQKYFGSIAPLADKEIYSITGAKLGWYDNASGDPDPRVPELAAAVPTEVVSHIESDREFLRVQPDRMSMSSRTAEDAAAAAAKTVFDIRKRRMELITGDYAETVFGEGLKTAIDRLDKTENEYLALFYGKQTVTYETVRYKIEPVEGTDMMYVARWNENSGLLPSSDLSGQPIVLELRPLGLAAIAYPPAAGKTGKGTADYIVADNVDCILIEGKTELARRTIPIYQMGFRRTM